MPQKKYFTLKEANSFVPKLLDDVPRIQKLASELMNDYPDVKNAWEKHKYNGGSPEGAAYLKAAIRLNNFIKELEASGCILKGINDGLVDFPSLREGKEVYLCWKVPEQEINYWHDLDSGFSGRQPISAF